MNLDHNTILIEGLINGEEKAYMFLLDKFHRKLNAYALTLANDHSMAQDIVQCVFKNEEKHKKN